MLFLLEDTTYMLYSIIEQNCKKQKNKTEKKDAQIVRKRAKELKKLLGKTFI